MRGIYYENMYVFGNVLPSHFSSYTEQEIVTLSTLGQWLLQNYQQWSDTSHVILQIIADFLMKHQ